MTNSLRETDPSAHTARIMARRGSRRDPLIQNLVSPISPSRSLFIERGEVRPSDWDHILEDQVVTLFLRPTTLLFAVEGREMELRVAAGQVAIGSRHSREAIRWFDETSILCVRLADGALDDATRTYLGRDRANVRATTHADDSRISNLLFTLDAERARGYPTGSLFLDGIEKALAALLVTSHGVGASIPANRRGGLSPQKLRCVVDFMHDNLARGITLDALSTGIGISPSHFSHQFRVSMGVSPYQYLRRLRVERAKEMLKNPRISILEIALATGFGNQQHFSSVFREIVGYCPSEFRRKL